MPRHIREGLGRDQRGFRRVQTARRLPAKHPAIREDEVVFMLEGGLPPAS